MSKSKRKSDPRTSGQRDLPGIGSKEPEPGAFDIDAAIRAWLVRASGRNPLSRAVIAARVGELVSRPDLSQAVWDAYCAGSKEGYRLPASYIPAVCWVLDDYEGLAILARAVGYDTVGPSERHFVELGRKKAKAARLAHEIAALEAEARRA
ncbi:MAG: hypothetical protein P9M14_16505 [Candidatus Alcyoniella australis]|nr:hypothetical protein [Candidatus Alcyoniella australis]